MHGASSSTAQAARVFVIAEIVRALRRGGGSGYSDGIGSSKTHRTYRPLPRSLPSRLNVADPWSRAYSEL
jgi:hypothetical protein